MSVMQDSLRARHPTATLIEFVLERMKSTLARARKAGAGPMLLAAAFLLSQPNTPLAAAGFGFGVFPQLSTRAMVETYQPLADHLSASIRQPVNLESARDFFTFHTRTINGEYDLVLTAPHLAWLAWKEGGYRPVLIYKEPAKGFVVVRADSPYHQLSDLNGRTIAIPDPNAVVNIRLAKALSSNGLDLGRELTVMEVGSHTNAAAHVSKRLTDAAVVGVFPFLRLPKEERQVLRIIASTPDLPSHVFLVHPRVKPEREREIRLAIEKFMRGEAGLEFLKKTGFGGVRSLEKDELKRVEGDALELKRRFQIQAEADGKPK